MLKFHLNNYFNCSKSIEKLIIIDSNSKLRNDNSFLFKTKKSSNKMLSGSMSL